MLLLTALLAGCGSPLAEQSATPASTAAPEEDAARVGEAAPTPVQLGSIGLLYMLPWKRYLPVAGLTSPTNMARGENGEAFVTDQSGLLLWFEGSALDPNSDVVAFIEFLDIRDRVSNRGSEEGLLGLALDPQSDGYFYVYYSAADPRRSVVSRFAYGSEGQPTVGPSADPDSELIILEIEQPYANHNGGQIAFGPDGFLYIGLGDGGAAGDPRGNGQDTSTLLGSILRIDVSEAAPDQPYAIPPDNPFADGGGRPEIWAWGLRNPWRFSFDRETGDLWTGDVGQNRMGGDRPDRARRQLRLEHPRGPPLLQAPATTATAKAKSPQSGNTPLRAPRAPSSVATSTEATTSPGSTEPTSTATSAPAKSTASATKTARSPNTKS